MFWFVGGVYFQSHDFRWFKMLCQYLYLPHWCNSMMHSYYKIIWFTVTPIRGDRSGQYFTAVATGGHSRLISNPAALLRWKRGMIFISLFLILSLSFGMYLEPLLKSLLYSDVFIINYTIWDHYSHTVVFLTTAEDFIICATCLSDSPQPHWACLIARLSAPPIQ